MWRAVALVALLSAAVHSTNAIATEGGYVPEPWLYETDKETQQAERVLPEEYYEMEDAYRQAARDDPQQAILEGIVEQMQETNRLRDAYPDEELEIDLQQPEEQQPQKQQEVRQEPKPAAASQKEEAPQEKPQHEDKPMVAQKKGQSEFVSFVEPVESKQTKAVPTLDKRRLKTSAEQSSHVPHYGNNLLMIAVGTVLMVGMVGTVVGGGVYLKRRRETPDDSEYAPYAGTGPGFKKGKKGDKGDETLAYKAQLHHYQQAKQKIICGDDAPGMNDSEGEDDGVDDENNFSVYECPGLAPTGDIEVVNPNFAGQP